MASYVEETEREREPSPVRLQAFIWATLAGMAAIALMEHLASTRTIVIQQVFPEAQQ